MFFKIVSIVGSMTFVSRILGYARDLLIARVIGAGLISDAFFVAFKLPNLFRRLFAEGSMNSAFIPIVSGVFTRSGRIKANEFFSKVFSGLLVFLFLLLIVFEIFMPLIINLIAPGFSKNPDKFLMTINFSRLAFPFVLFICLTSLAGSYLNTLGKFAAMALTPIILNLTLISVLIIFFNFTSEKIFVSKILSFSISMAGLIQIIWLIFNLKKNNVKLEINIKEIFQFSNINSDIKKLLLLLLPAIIGNGAYQINLLIDMILASTLPDGSISYLYYSDRINQLPLGVFGIAISTALLPLLSEQIKRNKKQESKKSISNAIKFSFIFSVPSATGIFLLSNEIVSFLFERGAFDSLDSVLTSQSLVALSIGLPAFILIKILVVPFFANEDTKTPIYVSLVSMVLNLILNLILIQKYLHVGLAIATSVSAWVNAFILFYILGNKKIVSFDKSILIVLLKVFICSLIMGLFIHLFMQIDKSIILENFFSEKKNLLLLIVIFSASIAYIFMIYLSNIKEIKSIKWRKKID